MKGGDFLRKNGVPDFGNGSKGEELNVSKSSPLYPHYPDLDDAADEA